jgi:hypothetical protein
VITEAVDTAFTLAWTLLVWVAVISAAGTLLLLGAVAVVAWGVRAAWRALSGRLRARKRGDYDTAA